MVHLNLVIEEGGGVNGTAQGVCPGTVNELQAVSPAPDITVMCVAYVSLIVH